MGDSWKPPVIDPNWYVFWKPGEFKAKKVKEYERKYGSSKRKKNKGSSTNFNKW